MKLSVVIPCRNEVDSIEECIEAIFASQLPEDLQVSVFIVDGMSNDGTLEIISLLKDKHSSLHLIENKKQLTPFAFNLGIRADETADYVQIIGARQIVSPDYLLIALKSLLDNETIWCIGGRVNNVFLNDTGRYIAMALSTSFGMGLGNFRALEESRFVDTVGTPMYPYQVFKEVGFFDEELIRNQDDEFNYRITKRKKKIYYDHEISLKYYVRGNFMGLWRQFFQYGYWKVYVNKKHKAVTTSRQLIPPLFVLYLLAVPFTCFFGPLIALASLVPLVLYSLMLLYFSFKAAGSIKEFIQIELTYLIVHFSYGLGYIKGIFEFLILGKKPSEKQKRLSR
ncbi:MAG: glycosyltransferase involved in cell wall biosynthesis [Crocinitomicaceae bacterium]|jgi:glycosyltransferase involved in cell wall biosynthesis